MFKAAGFDWREAGCSMCLGMNPDQLSPGERCASTSNRNFEGRQGAGGRTHLMSPAMAAAAAVTGYLTDVRKLTAGDLPGFPAATTQYDLPEKDSRMFIEEGILHAPATSAPPSSSATQNASANGANDKSVNRQ